MERIPVLEKEEELEFSHSLGRFRVTVITDCEADIRKCIPELWENPGLEYRTTIHEDSFQVFVRTADWKRIEAEQSKKERLEKQGQMRKETVMWSMIGAALSATASMMTATAIVLLCWILGWDVRFWHVFGWCFGTFSVFGIALYIYQYAVA